MSIKPKIYFAKVLSFQHSLSPGEIWTEEKLSLYREVPIKPSNELAMIGFIRHMSKQMFTHEKKKYLKDKVKLPIGVIQSAENRFETLMGPLWESVDIKETDLREIEKINKSTELAIPPTVIEILNKQLENARPVIEVGKISTEDQMIISEYLMVDMYAGEISKYFRSYKDFLDYLMEEGRILSIVIDDDDNRNLVIGM